MRVGLYGEDDYPPLSGLAAQPTAIKDGIVHLNCVSSTGRTHLVIGLDFPNERLLTDIIDGMISLDDGSEAAVRDAISVMAFKRMHFLNGELTLRRADTNETLGRCDPSIPVNVDMGGTVKNFDAIIYHLTKLAEQRRSTPA